MSKEQDKGASSENAPLLAAEKNEEVSAEAAEQQAEAAPPQGEVSEPAAEPTDAERIAALEREVAELRDQLLRKIADYENFRKRMFREREEAIAYANQMLLLDLVPTIDAFERALESAEASRDFDALRDGVAMIERELTSLLEKKWGLARFSAVGQPFDPDRHQAIATEENGDCRVPTVVEEYQRGYLLHNRVLRPARVKVARPGTARQTEGAGGADKET